MLFSFSAMNFPVTLCAECNQVPFGVIPGVAPQLSVVNLEVLRVPAQLASPSVAFEHQLLESPVVFHSKTQAAFPPKHLIHEAFIFWSNLCRVGVGRNFRSL